MATVIHKQLGNVTVNLFLDAKKVDRAIRRKNARVLYRTAGYTRMLLRRKIRNAPKRKKAKGSKTRAPYNRTGGLKHNFRFDVNVDKATAIIGPVPFKRTKTTKPIGRASGAALLEFGGSATLDVTEHKTKKQYRYRASFLEHPYIEPVYPKALDFFKQRLADIPLR